VFTGESMMGAVQSAVPERSAPGATKQVEDQLVIAAFARLRPLALGLSLGLVCGALLALATAIVLIEAESLGSPESVGAHLGLLTYYFPGYRVSWPGAIAGFAYATVYAGVLGALVAAFLNFAHGSYLRLVTRRMRRGVMSNDL
jgi:hypothetical protein